MVLACDGTQTYQTGINLPPKNQFGNKYITYKTYQDANDWQNLDGQYVSTNRMHPSTTQ